MKTEVPKTHKSHNVALGMVDIFIFICPPSIPSSGYKTSILLWGTTLPISSVL